MYGSLIAVVLEAGGTSRSRFSVMLLVGTATIDRF
jgi:hypothetical protein